MVEHGIRPEHRKDNAIAFLFKQDEMKRFEN